MKAKQLKLGFWSSLVVLIAFVFHGFSPVSAQSTSQGYLVKESMPSGTMVSINVERVDTVEAATLDNRERLLGVVVDSDQSVVSIGGSDNKVQVTSDGSVRLKVSSANGSIKSGDYLTSSAINGVAMKAATAGKVIGIAQQDFDDQAGKGKTSVDLTASDGKKKTVYVGTIVVKVAIQDWVPKSPPNSPALNNLRSFLTNIAGKPVSNAQALLSVAIILLAIIASGIILHSAISSSIHSIGRNPLSKGIIRRSLFIMIALSVLVIVGAGSAVYLILGG